MAYTQIEKQTDDLTKVTYRFFFREREMVLQLDFYAKYQRKTKRHGWKAEKFFSRLNDRSSQINVADVPMNDEIEKMALTAFISQLKVKKTIDK